MFFCCCPFAAINSHGNWWQMRFVLLLLHDDGKRIFKFGFVGNSASCVVMGHVVDLVLQAIDCAYEHAYKFIGIHEYQSKTKQCVNHYWQIMPHTEAFVVVGETVVVLNKKKKTFRSLFIFVCGVHMLTARWKKISVEERTKKENKGNNEVIRWVAWVQQKRTHTKWIVNCLHIHSAIK